MANPLGRGKVSDKRTPSDIPPQRLGIGAENHAREVKFLAARRIGELVPAENLSDSGKKGGRGKKGSEERKALVSPQRLSEFRKLAEGECKARTEKRLVESFDKFEGFRSNQR